ncbi:hypothetical protein IEQ44_14915 [Nocardioides sp. Y6]|uniref:Uncharacterized protein n=1 Tax=Nocardioides malaquae TaxID=2773426 RepID=A0ABR9RX44_9ACTN|nr:hypothetical protein [Nocardioides malaquae]MBE7325940.1 hypothetical protein [Nocardioides malaquae]
MTTWSRLLSGGELRQPDAVSCGACVAVVATALHQGAPPPADFGSEVWALHRRLTSCADLDGRRQWPWPRWWGTPPWALARHLTVVSGREHRVLWVRTGARRVVRRVTAALRDGAPVAVYVGSRLLPRHVVLALPVAQAGVPTTTDLRWTVHDPASGRTRHIDLDAWRRGRLTPGWPRPWWVVVPTAGRHDRVSRR